MKVAWACTQIYTPMSPQLKFFSVSFYLFIFFKFFMQFQMILWAFNCKSNKILNNTICYMKI